VALAGSCRLLGIAAGVIAAAVLSARAQGTRLAALPTATGCRAELVGGDILDGGKVRAITDGRSFVLEDGREIRLAGIEVPLPPGPAESGARAAATRVASQVSLAALESILAGQSVEVCL
jgi:hypothetical protein